ncbi:MAG: hypothetical protein ETSY2_08240 [Candidatus Entotheonella gemina]|uniref:Uncharacterized protein n=1 Tax=Candidatus Entotheonella gemina TaxID=1429439 RepID=W4ME99_9BACT|nr:MAG: hypothetical protein ETSY2_08240 [Candidatus Entotheonella gemina]
MSDDESKTWFEVLLTPLAVAVIGIVGTYFITNKQHLHTKSVTRGQQLHTSALKQIELSSQEVRAKEDRETQFLNTIIQSYINGDEEKRKKSIILIKAIRDLDLAKNILDSIASSESNNNLRQTAEKAKHDVDIQKKWKNAVYGQQIEELKNITNSLRLIGTIDTVVDNQNNTALSIASEKCNTAIN